MNLNLYILTIMLPLIKSYQTANLGSLKFSVQPDQQFEQQFSHIPGISSIDLYFTQFPYRKVLNEDLDCYWSKQNMGLQKVAEWPINMLEEDFLKGDLLCLGVDICYLTAGNNLYIVGTQIINQKPTNAKKNILISQDIKRIYIPFNEARFLDLSVVGIIGLLNKENQIYLLDITNHLEPKKTIYTFSNLLQESLQSSIEVSINPSTFTMYVNLGGFIEIWNVKYLTKIHKLGIIYAGGIAYSRKQEQNIKSMEKDQEDLLTDMNIQENLLFLFSQSKGILVFDVSEPSQIHQIITLFSEEDDIQASNQKTFLKMKVKKDRLLLMHRNYENQNYMLFQYYIVNDKLNPQSLRLNFLQSGQINVRASDTVTDLYIVDGESALLIQDFQVTLIQLAYITNMTTHQKTHHGSEFNLVVSQHLLPSQRNQIYSAFGNILQFHDNKLKMFQESGESDDIFCSAPGINITKNQLTNFEYYGIIRSKENCSKKFQVNSVSMNSPKLQTIMEREYNEAQDETQCILAFEMIIQVEKLKTEKISSKALMMLFIFLLLVIAIVGKTIFKSIKSKMLSKTLKKFEELNNKLGIDTKQRIRITHHNLDISEDDAEEWRALAIQQQNNRCIEDTI